MELQIATPEKILFEGQVDDAVLQAEKGELNILDRHADLISFLRAGRVRLKNAGALVGTFEVTDGILKIEDQKLMLLCPSAKEIGSRSSG